MDIQYNRNEEFKTVALSSSSQQTSKSSRLDEQQKPADENGDEASETVKTSTSASQDAEMANSATGEDTASTQKTATTPKVRLDLNDDSDIETTVIFVPNIWSLMPNSIEYQKIAEAYKHFIDNPPVDKEEEEDQDLDMDDAEEEAKTSATQLKSVPKDSPKEATTKTDEASTNGAEQTVAQEQADSNGIKDKESSATLVTAENELDVKDTDASLLLKAH